MKILSKVRASSFPGKSFALFHSSDGSQEVISILWVSKRFRSASPRSGERGRYISGLQAAWQIGATEELVQESGIEAVSGPDRVHDFHRYRRTDKAISYLAAPSPPPPRVLRQGAGTIAASLETASSMF